MPHRPDPWHGAHSYQRFRAVLGDTKLRYALRHGRLVQPWRGVVVPRERMGDPRTMAAAALMAIGGGAVLSGFTAASMYGCAAADTHQVHVTVPYSRWPRSRPGLVIRHSRFATDDVVELDGLPVLAPDLVFSELLCTGPRPTALACADQLMRSLPGDLQPVFREQMHHRLDRRDDRRGVSGAHAMVDLITERVETPQESWLRLLVVDHGFPLPESQYEVRDRDGTPLRRVALAWPELRIALAYSGPDRRPLDSARDAGQDRALSRKGWISVRAGAADLRAPTALMTRLWAAFRQRRAAGCGDQVGPRPAQGLVRRSLT
ncbi:hypothetical protein [Allokutzneria oryzae]|uniref:Uncharacterized protein n=1 Tax=Allokutzneria oryzae TaxID=1378989 RepID=A0ABV5ZV05_9PSEU